MSASLLQRGTAATLNYLSKRLPPDHRPRDPIAPSPAPVPFSLPGHAGAGSSLGGKGGSVGGGIGMGIGGGAGSTGGGVGCGGAGGGGGAENREALERLAALRAEVSALSEEMEAPGLSQAKAYAVKKKLQMKRAAVIREERALKQAQQSGGTRR